MKMCNYCDINTVGNNIVEYNEEDDMSSSSFLSYYMKCCIIYTISRLFEQLGEIFA